MEANLLPWIIVVVSLFVGFMVAHGLGLLASGMLRVHPGRIREWMPSMPGHMATKGRPEVRWERRRARVEGRVLRLLAGGATAVHAADMAGRLGEDPMVVEDVLGHIRDEIPCRLRVTNAGLLLHDFTAEDIATLRHRRRLALPVRLLLFVLGLGANAGAAWPVVVTVAVAATTLSAMAMTDTENETLGVGAAGVGALLVLLGVTLGSGLAVRLALWPWMRSPRLGHTLSNESEPLEARDPLLAMIFPGSEPVKGHDSKQSKAKKRKKSLLSFGSFDLDAFDDPRGCLIALVVIVLLGILVLASFALYLWVRGIWRAVGRLGEPDPIVSPAAWIRATPPGDWIERLIPTNDLVLRITRVLRRTVSRTHPRDGEMPLRILARAARQGGRVAALEVALSEALDLGEATAICARLTGLLEGEILVTDGGELDFRFTEETLSRARTEANANDAAEFLRIDAKQDVVARRERQHTHSLPVNLPGLTMGHLHATDRFVSGTVMMMVCAVAALQGVAAPAWMAATAALGLGAVTVSAFVLAAMARYLSRASAIHGVKRDARRAGVALLRHAVEHRQDSIEFKATEQRLEQVFKPAWPSLPSALVDHELEGVCIDFDLDPIVDESTGQLRYSTHALLMRVSDIAHHRLEVTSSPADSRDDLVVFDTFVEHQRIRSLI